jgi:GTP-binding protein
MKHIEKNLYFMTWAPVIFTSALDHKRVQQIFDMAGVVIQERSKRISTAELNRFLEKVVDHWQPPEKQAKEVKLYYITQTDTTPPHFTLFVNLRKSIPDEYMRYLLNCIRDEFGFIGTPITLNIRAKQKTKQ